MADLAPLHGSIDTSIDESLSASRREDAQ